ncbi:conserved hypothetical protein [Leishmania major strain Friedlin]|uniref:Uncharacterized protein n=1 Tax=Leishmania major TaxID=5664 RepID=Q4QBD0_LEIMA|nr:conserved hypothetical protein [Leishmania major strain Friedlin]CAG9574160.1 hypothetical_protein_-_conserved [Leishmania major strain Friedlin]CAJ04109.1 conserved hypothetical protein [Leishmania major strain Friedlin]|eukprot:XP_001683368.1 conserved hypothetical protein [Leishmania major strain Friedlin]
MNIVTSYFLVRKLPGTLAMGGDVLEHQNARQREYMECLRLNQQHPGVASIHLIVEGADAYEHLLKHVLCNPHFQNASTLTTSTAPASARHRRRHAAPIVPVVRFASGMPLYADFFAYANQLLSHRLTMVCNADVYLSPEHFSLSAVEDLFRQSSTLPPPHAAPCGSCQPSTADLAEREAMRPKSAPKRANPLALALTRYESDSPLDAPFLFDYRGSHDAFVLVPPVPPSFVRSVAHPQNCYKAENIVLHELQQSGYLTLNPTLGDGVRLVHRHATDLRQWFPPVDESRYGRAQPNTLAQAASRIREEARVRSLPPSV